AAISRLKTRKETHARRSDHDNPAHAVVAAAARRVRVLCLRDGEAKRLAVCGADRRAAAHHRATADVAAAEVSGGFGTIALLTLGTIAAISWLLWFWNRRR